MPRMIVINPNENTIYISNENGVTVLFSDNAHFQSFYPSLDFSGKKKLSYEPDKWDAAIHLDHNANIKVWIKDPTPEERNGMRVSEYETLIDAVDQLHADMIDPYYGQDLTTAKDLKRTELSQEAEEILRGKYEFLDIILRLASNDSDFKKDADDISDARDVAFNLVNAASTAIQVKVIQAVWPAI